MSNTTLRDRMSDVSRSNMYPMLIIGTLFFTIGFVTWLSSVLIPYLQIACELTVFQSYMVAFAFYISYLIMAIPSAWLLKITGFKKGMSVGLLLAAAGSLLFVPAAIYRQYSIFLIGLFFQGAGLTLLQTAANPYITILGPIESAAKRMCMMGVCNGVAGILAPVILGAVILNNVDAINQELLVLADSEKKAILDGLAQKVIIPYLIITLVVVLLAVMIYQARLPEIDEESPDKQDDQQEVYFVSDKASVFHHPHLLFGVLALFVYTGVEVIAANSIISYGSYLKIPMATAKFFSSFTLIGMLIGFLVGILCIPRYISQQTGLKVSAVLGILFGLSAILTEGYWSITFVVLLGLSNSLIGAAIWPLALRGLGKFTKIGSALLVMSISGASLIPLLYGWFTDKINAQQAYWVVIPCYVIIGWYALFGCKIGLLKKKGM